MKKIITVILLLAVVLTGCAGNQNGVQEGSNGSEQPETKYMTFAAPPSTSSLYSFWVAVSNAVSKTYPELQISVSESQGAIAIANRVRADEADVGNSMSVTDYENYHGLGSFDGDPNEDLRMLFYYQISYEMFLVSKDSGIKSLSDLDGQRFNPGGTGGTSAALAYSILDIFGIEPDYFEAGQADAADAYANRQAVGTVKLGPLGDSYVLQMDAARPVTIISMTDEEISTIQEEYPYLMKVTIPAGTFDSITEDISTVATPAGAVSSKNLSQEDGYKIVKAVIEDGRATWGAAYPSAVDNDIVGMTLDSAVPLHAGTVQYLVEKGHAVPEDLIPSEYVPVN